MNPLTLLDAAPALLIINNLIMQAVKWLAGESVNKYWLRTFLTVLSLLGVIATAAVSGQPVDLNQVSQIVQTLAATVGIALAGHLFYKVQP